jgi:hypothetical protein
MLLERAGEVDEPGLVGDAEQCAANGLESGTFGGVHFFLLNWHGDDRSSRMASKLMSSNL